MDSSLKVVLKALVDDIEQLKANQVVIAKAMPGHVDLDVARLAKDQALRESRGFYDNLRKQIEALSK